MPNRSAFHVIRPLGCTAVMVLVAGLCHAQRLPGVKGVPQAPAPAIAPAVSSTGLGTLNPTGLPSAFPAGLPSPGDTAPGSPAIDAGIAITPPAGARVIATVPGAVPVPGVYTAQQIAASFIGADTNRDGELTRAEAQRLTIAPSSFEEMDQNKDGVVSRSEYEAAFTR